MARAQVAVAVFLWCTTFLWCTGARAQDQTLMFDGEVPSNGPDHFFVPFDVPEGIVEIEVRHDDMSTDNILDFGVDDPNGTRGWGGGTEEPAIIGVEAASRSYLYGPIGGGQWRVVIGKAKINMMPALYHLEVVLRQTATLPPQPERTPYMPAPALTTEARWYAGDFHTHSYDSTDARPPLEEMIVFAQGHGLDFIAITDHNNHAALSRFASVQANHADFLLVPGVEFTTYAGHANAIGATTFVDHKIGLPGVTIEGAAQQYRDQGAFFSINHPALDIGDLCIGCAWKHDLALELIDGMEIETGGFSQSGYLFTEVAIKKWDALCAQGRHVVAMGGSDDHDAGVDEGNFGSPISNPTTMVYAESLSVEGILAGLRAGRTVVKLQDANDPMIELSPDVPADGDTVRAEAFTLHVRVTGGTGDTLNIVADGAVHSEIAIDADPFDTDVAIEAPLEGESRWRAEVWNADGDPRTVTSHVWAAYQAGVRGGTTPTEAAGGCGCRLGHERGTIGWLTLIAGLGFIVVRRRTIPTP